MFTWPEISKPYQAHALHAASAAWPETNCYVDLWIEVLHALRLNPLAALGFTLSLDWEGDQFSFFKMPAGDLDRLYGISIGELNVWWSLEEQVAVQVARGQLPIVDADAFFLPDTQGTSYRAQHTKTSVGVRVMDRANKRIEYFHNAGYFALEGHDYEGIFSQQAGSMGLAPYVELAKLEGLVRRDDATLRKMALELLVDHNDRRRARDATHGSAMTRFATTLPDAVVWMRAQGGESFHAYAFAAIRQLGAACELLGAHLHWLDGAPGNQFATASEHFASVASLSKTLQFKLARAAASAKAFDADAATAEIAEHLREGFVVLDTQLAKGAAP
jgi:hypothetical protein